MDPRVERGIKKFLTDTLVKWLGTIETDDIEIKGHIRFLKVAIKDISQSSMFGDSLDNTASGLDEIAYELGAMAKVFTANKIASRAGQAKRFEKYAETFVQKIEKELLKY